MTIVIAGGSGIIGSAITKALLAKGHTVIVVDVTGPQFTHEALFFIQCDLTKQPLPYNVLERTDALINLVGVPFARKWNAEYKKLIFDSRIKSTRALVAALEQVQTRPTVFITASSIAYYGDTHGSIVDERAEKGDGFLAEVVSEWETEAMRAEQYNVRTIIIRNAPVLTHAGILYSITKTKAFGFLLYLTRANYWMSWIHEVDMMRIYLFALETTTLVGAVNAVAPEAIQHKEFVNIVGHLLQRKIGRVMPAWLLRKMFGEMAGEITKSQRVLPQRLIDKGFEFKFPDAKVALASIYDK